MWVINKDTNKWVQKSDTLSMSDFQSLKEDLKSLRFYQKVLSGTTYVSMDNDENIYNILNNESKTYNYSGLFSPYISPYFGSISNESQISSTTSQTDFLEKSVSEYGLTLKNLFTPKRLISDQLKNLFYVDVCTNDIILTLLDKNTNRIIDDIKLKEGHRVLVKDQYDLITIETSQNPEDYFLGNYQIKEVIGSNTTYLVYNSENGIYLYKDSKLIRTNDLDNYESLINYSICVKLGTSNRETQWSLQRLKSKFYPKYSESEPIYFKNRHNYVLRNRMDYNNLFDLVLNDTIKSATHSIIINGIVHTIPERTISIGEFGVIFNHQEGYTNIINTKFKKKLRSISETINYYWISGDDGLLLKVNKINFDIVKIILEDSISGEINNLNSVSFFNELRGVVVGKFNQIWVTSNGGYDWKRIYINDFEKYNFNVVIYSEIGKFYVGGDNGVFIEFSYEYNNWTAYKRRISKFVDIEDEFLLVDDIKDIEQFTATQSNFFNGTQSFIAISCKNNNIYLYDRSNIITNSRDNKYDFINLDFNYNFSDINSLSYLNTSLIFSTFTNMYISNPLSGTFSNEFSNILSTTYSIFIAQSGVNKISNYDNEIIYTGIKSLWKKKTIVGSPVDVYDDNFFLNLKPRLLFMDYDAGSKVYWFDDYGQYRLPSKLIVPVNYLIDSNAISETSISFRQNTNNIFNKSTGLTSSYFENNWITYWKDRLKTFEYYTHIDDSFKVEPSFDFRSSDSLSGIFEYSFTNITTLGVNIENLMPSINSRFREGTVPISQPSSNFDIYFNKFLGIWAITLLNSDTPPLKGDVIYLESNVTSGKFIINKVFPIDNGLGETTYYQYFYTEFNENILNNLANFTGTLKIRNLNIYPTKSGGVKEFSSNYVGIFQQGSYVGVESQSITGSSATFNIEVNGAGQITSIILRNVGFGYGIGDIITVDDFNILITIDSLNYASLFIDNFRKHFINLAYSISEINDFYIKPDSSPIGLTQSFEISGKYSQYSAYYNLQSNIEVLNTTGYLIEDDILYESSFLNFGYTPTYNLLSYLNFVDGFKYNIDKEFLSLPKYDNIPGPDSGIIDTLIVNDNLIYIDMISGEYSGKLESNKLFFGVNLKGIWDSFFKWTFIDLELKDTSDNLFNTNRLLITDKYYDTTTYDEPYYVISFHDSFSGNNNISSISLHSRRTLQQISDDLQYVNKIQRPQWLTTVIEPGYSFKSFETDINFKVPTDSYTKVLLSDSDILNDITGVIYTDYKSELALQITKLSKQFEFEPTSIIQSINSKYQISFTKKHQLKNGDGIIIENIGDVTNWPILLGYHPIKYINDYNIEIPIDWIGFLPSDHLNIRYIIQDPFLNFEPIDIFDIGVGDKKVKQSIEITTDKYDIKKGKYFLKDIDYKKYRFRLIDGLDLERLSDLFYWILDAEVSGAIIGMDEKQNLIWYKGTWEGGRWLGGTWVSGTWKSGDWYDGSWSSKLITDGLLSVKVDKRNTNSHSSKWYGGRWYGGTWENGSWYDGRWYGGTWENGSWYDGTWNGGTWNDGVFSGGIWIIGTWNKGVFNTDSSLSYWLDGKFLGGDFENGYWYNGEFNQLNDIKSRFGTKSFNSRNSIWYGGKFLKGEFHSFLNTNDNNLPDVSDIHKYSKWYSGVFNGGVFYGGDVYNINFNSSLWKGGILNEINIIGIKSNNSNNHFILDGIYRFNINDTFYIVDKFNTSIYSVFGSTEYPKKYKVLDVTIDEDLGRTEIFVDFLLSDIYSIDTGIVDTNLKCVSSFKNSTWDSGIWFNGVFDNGYFNGGIWYHGNFSGIWG